jgi:hypothetical protein
MKKNILSLTAIALIASATIFTGCKKDDTTAPVVTINGADITISLQGVYTELNATAEDDKDGAITPTISGTVDVNHTGVYVITYMAMDAAGNEGTAVRNVTVVNDVDGMTGTYTCTITGSPNYVYQQTITASSTMNKRILFGKFGDYTGNTGIYADVVGTTITLPSQTAVLVGSPATNRTFAGSGSIVTGGFGLTYTETTATGSINTVEGFVKN